MLMGKYLPMFQSNLSPPSKSEKFKRVEYLDLKTEKTTSF